MKKVLSIALVALLLMGTFAVAASANTPTPPTWEEMLQTVNVVSLVGLGITGGISALLWFFDAHWAWQVLAFIGLAIAVIFRIMVWISSNQPPPVNW